MSGFSSADDHVQRLTEAELKAQKKAEKKAAKQASKDLAHRQPKWEPAGVSKRYK